MTLRELYKTNARWRKGVKINIRYPNGDYEYLYIDEALLKYGDSDILWFVNDIVTLQK